MNQPCSMSVDALLAETRWLRRLALELVGEPAGADDLTQDAMVAALERQPALRGSLRPWLKTVAHRLWIERQRARARDSQPAADARDAVPSAADAVARFELHRRVAEAVAGLAEPYRTAVLLRFYESLPPRTVASRTGVPVETARTRIRRGLTLLRGALDRAAGSRAGWALPLVERVLRSEQVPAAAGAAWLGGTVVVSIKIALASLVLIAAAVVAVMGSLFAPAYDLDPSAGPTGRPLELAVPPAASPPQGAARVAELVRHVASAPQPVAQNSEEPRERAQSIALRFSVADAEGRVTTQLDGTAKIALMAEPTERNWATVGEAGRTRHAVVPVAGGRATVMVDPGQVRILVITASFEGGWVQRQSEATWLPARPWRDTTEVELRGVWLETIPVRVVDAARGLDLADVEVRKSMEQHGRHPSFGAAVDVIARRAASPFRVPRADPPRTSTVLWFHAPGTAWKAVDVPHERHQTVTVTLEPGGTLDVAAAGVRPKARSRVALYDAPAQSTEASDFGYPVARQSLPPNGESATFEGLRPGAYVIRVEEEAGYRWRVAGVAAADVHAGERASARVVIHATPPPPPLAPVSGTLVVPSAWGRRGASLAMVPGPESKRSGPIDVELAVVDGSPGHFRWSVELREGSWEAWVGAPQWKARVDVPAGGVRDVWLELPPPADVHLTLVDADTGETLRKRSLRWSCPGVIDTGHSAKSFATRWTEAGAYAFRAPASDVAVWFLDELTEFPRIPLQPGANVLRVPFRRRCGVRVQLRESGELLGWDDACRLQLQARDDASETTEGGDHGRLRAPRPGRYRLLVVTPPWYEPCTPLPVDIAPGEFTEVTVDVELR